MTTRRLDSKARLSVPRGVLEALGIGPGADLDVSVDGRAFVAVPVKPCCCACGAQEPGMAGFDAGPVRHICSACAAKVREAR